MPLHSMHLSALATISSVQIWPLLSDVCAETCWDSGEKGREWPGSLSMLGAMPEAGTDQESDGKLEQQEWKVAEHCETANS